MVHHYEKAILQKYVIEYYINASIQHTISLQYQSQNDHGGRFHTADDQSQTFASQTKARLNICLKSTQEVLHEKLVCSLGLIKQQFVV